MVLLTVTKWINRESGLVGWGVTIRVRKFPVQTKLGAQLGLGTQPCYEIHSDFRVEIVKTQLLTAGEWGCPLNNGSKLAVRKPHSSLRKVNDNFWHKYRLWLRYNFTISWPPFRFDETMEWNLSSSKLTCHMQVGRQSDLGR